VYPVVGHSTVWENPPEVVVAAGRDVIDPHLLQRIVARDSTAVAELYDRCGSALYGVILRILGRPADADEILQEVFIRIWTRAEMYDETCGTPMAWLMRMARNRAIDCLRARRVRGDVDTPAQPLDTLQGATAAAATPELLAEAAEQGSAVRNALAALPDEQRSLIEAAFFEGYTHRELADRSGLPLGTVKTRIRNGMMTMRQRLERPV
jgi:RNA polymerase sigma-70 factor (ECF subfamily)